MTRRRWLLILSCLGIVSLLGSIGATSASMVDRETSNGNDFEAWTSSIWTQTSQGDFEAGVLSQVDTTASPGNVILGVATNTTAITDTFADESKIASKSNLVVTGGQVKLTSGSTPGTETLRPNAAGTSTQCTAVGDSPNYQCVDESVADTTTYVRTSFGATQLDTYNIANRSQGSGTISSVTVHIMSRASATGSAGFEIAIRTHNVNYFGNYFTTTSTSFTDFNKTWATNPNTSSAWTWTEIDALEAGVRQTDVDFTPNPDTTQVYVEVSYNGPIVYNSPGTLTSTNLLSGLTVISIDSFDYIVSAIPAGTSLKVRFSQNGSNWYDSAGSAGAWDTLASGSHSIDLGALGWTGANFYYQLEFTSDGTDTPVMDEITVNVSVPAGPSDWYDVDWPYRREIAIDHTMVVNVASPSITYADFPVLVSATGLSNINANGTDIRFTTSNGITELPREIESYSGGTLYAWVKLTLTKDAGDSTNDIIYMYYGNTSASEPAPGSAYGSQNVWNTGYKGVWHLKENPAGTAPQMKDSTSVGNDGTSGGSMTSGDQVAGKIDGSLNFDGFNDWINLGNDASLQITTVTIEVWCKPAVTGVYMGIGGKVQDTTDNGFALSKVDTNKFRFQTATGGVSTSIDSNSAYADTNWHYVVGLRTGGVNYLFVDGVQQTQTSTASITDSGLDAHIGRQYVDYNGRWWNGDIDEFRISSTSRSAQWIRTEYNNQNSPTTFCVLQGEEEMVFYASSGTLASQVLDTGTDGARWDGLFWSETLPAGTDVTFELRASDTAFAAGDASPSWSAVGGTSPVTDGLPSGRYMQWRVTLTTSDQAETPILSEAKVYYY